GYRVGHALHVAEHRFDTPEAAAGEDRGFEAALLGRACGGGCIEVRLRRGGRAGSHGNSGCGDKRSEAFHTSCGTMCTARIAAVTPNPMKKARKRSGVKRPI